MGLAAQEHAELYKCEIENISSSILLSDLSRALRNSLHSLCSSPLANLNEGPTYIISLYPEDNNIVTK